jgi:hypothetical protein
MKNKIVTNMVSIIIGVFLAYQTFGMPISPSSLYGASLSELWRYHIQHFWWLMLIFFFIGYGITFLIFWLFNRNKES